MHDGAVVSLMHRDGDEQSWCGVVLVLFFLDDHPFVLVSILGFFVAIGLILCSKVQRILFDPVRNRMPCVCVCSKEAFIFKSDVYRVF
jgi:hypothetical protein